MIKGELFKMSEKETNGKLKVDIYVPLDACACEWDKFMNRVFVELTPYIKHIDFDTKNLNSEEAKIIHSRLCSLLDSPAPSLSSPPVHGG